MTRVPDDHAAAGAAAYPPPGRTAAVPAPGAQRGWTHVRPLREEIASAIIQGLAAAASVVGLVYLVARDRPHLDALGLAAVVIYAAASCVAFLASALYHGVQNRRIRAVLQRIDHCTIFLLIAGTYTPVALLPLRHHGGIALLAAIWTVALTGIVLRLGNERLYRRVAIPLYVIMGWLGLGWSAPLYREVGTQSILLMALGAASYTGGLLFYRWHSRPFTNSAWHLCVVAGGAWFFCAIARFAAA